MLQIFSFDPGLITGWCRISITEDGQVGYFTCGETNHLGVGNMLLEDPSLMAAVNNRTIETVFVLETFTMNSKISQQPASLETIGLIKYFAQRHGVPVKMVPPSSHKNLIKDRVLQRAGLWSPSPDGHQVDAARLGLWYLVTKRKVLRDCLKESR